MPDQQLPPDLWDKIRSIAAVEVQKFARSGFLNSAAVARGDFTVMGGGSLVVKDGGDIVVDPDGQARSSDFDGDLPARNPGTTGWAIDHDTAAFADLLLRPGSVGNDALTTPVESVAVYDYLSDFALTTTLTNIKTLAVPVPAGFTKAAVTLTVRVYAINGTAGLDYLYSQANINGYNGLALPVAATGSGGSAMNVSTFSTVLPPELLGDTLNLQIAAQTAFGEWAASTANAADLSASISWYR